MKLAVTLTVDGLIRSLRGLAHGLAEDADRDYARRPDPRRTRPDDAERNEEISHDRRRV